MGRTKRKCVFEHAQNTQIQTDPTHVQNIIHPDICFLLIKFIAFNDYLSECTDQTARMRRLIDCADAQAYLGFRCPHMP